MQQPEHSIDPSSVSGGIGAKIPEVVDSAIGLK